MKQKSTKPYAVKDLAIACPQQLVISMVGPWRVSTIDLSMAGQFVALADSFLDRVFDRPSGRFETMVFRGDDAHALDCARYTSADAAKIGHKKMTKKWAKIRKVKS